MRRFAGRFAIGAAVLLASINTLAADPRPAGVTGETWQFGPLNRWAYTHLREILPTKDIPNDYRTARALPGIETARSELDVIIDGKRERLDEAMERLYVDGMLVIQDGQAVLERYAGNLKPDRTHLLWSVSKTITGLTAASVYADGLIDLDKTVADYVPELGKSGWADDTLRNILDMRDSSDWTEDYDAPDSTVRRQDCADGLLTGAACEGIPVTGNYDFLPQVGKDPSRTGAFAYKSGTTDVMAWVLEAATGERFADLVAERLWKPMGAEQSAHITVDTGGFTLASGGMSATLRDIARIGQLMLDRGRVGDTQVVPSAWIDDITEQKHPLRPVISTPGPWPRYYRSFVWGIGDGAGTVYAEGVHGQFIFVSPSTRTVIAMFSSWPNADGGAPGVGHGEALELLFAIRDAVTD